MPDRLVFRTVTPDGQPGDELGTAELRDGEVVATPGVATDTIEMLTRRTGRDAVTVFGRLVAEGWSNGQIMVTSAT
ncbi:hypothetical protein AB0C10_21425 [Microbispora amethystogenes]|uniref:hypothetical protein n=1 Tax=Microbispora amethystogenes TaxID=1427754 RepID=UPI0033F07597